MREEMWDPLVEYIFGRESRDYNNLAKGRGNRDFAACCDK